MYTVPREVLELWKGVHIYRLHVDLAVVSLLLETMGLHFVLVELKNKIKGAIKNKMFPLHFLNSESFSSHLLQNSLTCNSNYQVFH